MSQYNRKLWFWVLLGLGFLLFLFMIRAILLPFVVGAMVAYFLDPAADWLEKKGFSRLAATAILTVSFFAVVISVLFALAPVLYNQFTGLMNALPGYIAHMREAIAPHVQSLLAYIDGASGEDTREALNGATASLFGISKNFAAKLFASGVALVNLFTLIFLTPVVTFYLLRDWDVMVAKVDDLLPRDSAATIREQFREMDNAIAGYLRGQVNVCLLLCVYYVVALGLVGMKYAVLVGLMAGLISFIPFVGALVSLATAAIIAFFQFGVVSGSFVAVLAIFAFGLVLENNILVPRLIGEKVGLHPAWVIFGMLTGAVLFGFVGILLAVPLTAVIGVLARFATERYRQSDYYLGKQRPKRSTTKA